MLDAEHIENRIYPHTNFAIVFLLLSLVYETFDVVMKKYLLFNLNIKTLVQR